MLESKFKELSHEQNITQLMFELSDFNAFANQAELSDKLIELYDLLNKNSTFYNASNAVFKSIQALSIPATDQLLEKWQSWSMRYPWISAEVEFAILSEKGQNLQNSEVELLYGEIENFRRIFAAAEDGWPIESTLDLFYQTEIKRTSQAICRYGLYRLAADCLREDANPTKLFNVNNLNNYAGYNEQELNLLYEIIENAKVEGDTSKDVFKRVFTSFLNSPNSCYEELLKLSEDQRFEFINRFSVAEYSSFKDIPHDFFDNHKKCLQQREEASQKFFNLDAEDLKKELSRDQFSLIIVTFDQQYLYYGVTFPKQKNFLQRSLDKLQQFSVIADYNRDSIAGKEWQYFTGGNAEILREAKSYKIDTLSLFYEIVEDCALARRDEAMYAIFDLDNISLKAHERIGFQRLEGQSFIDDQGNTSIIMQLSFPRIKI
jgi:hypothetical protein